MIPPIWNLKGVDMWIKFNVLIPNVLTGGLNQSGFAGVTHLRELFFVGS